MSRYSANALLLLAGAIWGFTFVAQQTAMEYVGPFTFIALRFLVASLVVLPFALRESNVGGSKASEQQAQPLPMLRPVHFVQYASIGLCLFAGMGAQQVALQTISVTNSGFLTSLYMIFTPFLGVLLFMQWPHRIVWPASFLAVAGIFLLAGGNFAALSTGDLLTILGAVFWALQIVLIGRFIANTQRPLALSVVQFAVTSLLAFCVALVFETWSMQQIVAAGKEILFTGIFSTGIAFSLQVIGQRYTTAPQAAIFLSSESLFAALFGAAVLGERIGMLGLTGCALIFIAMLAVEVVPEWKSGKTARSG